MQTILWSPYLTTRVSENTRVRNDSYTFNCLCLFFSYLDIQNSTKYVLCKICHNITNAMLPVMTFCDVTSKCAHHDPVNPFRAMNARMHGFVSGKSDAVFICVPSRSKGLFISERQRVAPVSSYRGSYNLCW